MNPRIEHCLYQAGLTAQGCWNELDDYARQGIEKFAELLIQECANIDFRREVGLTADDDYEVGKVIKEHFGVEQ